MWRVHNFLADLGINRTIEDIKRWEEVKDVERLIKTLSRFRDEDEDVRKAAIEALVKIGVPAVKPFIARLWEVKAPAEVLVKIGTSALQPLITALRDEDCWAIRENAIEALGMIGVPAVEPLIAILRDENSGVRSAAAEALGKIGDKRKRAVEPLIAALGDKDDYLRETAAVALGKICDKRAVEPLTIVLRDKGSVRQAAAKALETIGWQPKDDTERLWFLIAQRKWSEVNEKDVKRVTKDYRQFIAKGESEGLLIVALNQRGNTNYSSRFTMAVDFLNCGNANLAEAGREWAYKHDYTITYNIGSPAVRWGSLR